MLNIFKIFNSNLFSSPSNSNISNSIPDSPISILRREELLSIFSHLEKTDLGSCLQVCKLWNELGNNNRLWLPLVSRIFIGDNLNATNCKEILREYESKQLRSEQEILDHLQTFINKISRGQNGRFRCIINSRGRSYTLSLIIKGDMYCVDTGDGNLDQEYVSKITNFDLKEDYFAQIDLNNLPWHEDFSTYRINEGFSSRTIRGDNITTIFTTPSAGPFQTEFRFPVIDINNRYHKTFMESKINKILDVKLNNLYNQQLERDLVFYFFGLGICASSAYLLFKLKPK